MRRIVVTLIIVLSSVAVYSQDVFAIKANAIGGYILPLTQTTKSIAPNPTIGGELSIEFPSWGAYPWQQYWGKPTLGVGFVGLDLGDNEILGQAFAVYPYLLVHLTRSSDFELSWKFGAGASFFNKTYNRLVSTRIP